MRYKVQLWSYISQFWEKKSELRGKRQKFEISQYYLFSQLRKKKKSELQDINAELQEKKSELSDKKLQLTLYYYSVGRKRASIVFHFTIF